MTLKKNSGFTLIEILIAFAILTLLALMGFMAWQNQAARARDARRKADIKRLNIAFEDYYADDSCYPPADILTNCGGDELKTYLDGPIPCDPLTHTPYCYIYDSEAPVCQEFRILASLENASDPDIGKLGCAGPDYCGYEEQCSSFGSGFNYGFSSTNITVLNPNTPFSGPSPSVSPAPLPSGSPHPGGGSYIYACDQNGICNSWDHYPVGCYFFTNDNCDNICSNPAYWCVE